LQKATSQPSKTYRPFSLVEGGIPQGGVVEISGSAGGGKVEALLRFLSENPTLPVAWVEEGRTTYPCAFPQAGVDLERVLFVNAEAAQGESYLLDCAHQILRSQIFGALVLLPEDSLGLKVHPHNHHTIVPRGSSSSQAARTEPEPRGAATAQAIDLRR